LASEALQTGSKASRLAQAHDGAGPRKGARGQRVDRRSGKHPFDRPWKAWVRWKEPMKGRATAKKHAGRKRSGDRSGVIL
jgi:hypothetical protein